MASPPSYHTSPNHSRFDSRSGNGWRRVSDPYSNELFGGCQNIVRPADKNRHGAAHGRSTRQRGVRSAHRSEHSARFVHSDTMVHLSVGRSTPPAMQADGEAVARRLMESALQHPRQWLDPFTNARMRGCWRLSVSAGSVRGDWVPHVASAPVHDVYGKSRSAHISQRTATTTYGLLEHVETHPACPTGSRTMYLLDGRTKVVMPREAGSDGFIRRRPPRRGAVQQFAQPQLLRGREPVAMEDTLLPVR